MRVIPFTASDWLSISVKNPFNNKKRGRFKSPAEIHRYYQILILISYIRYISFDSSAAFKAPSFLSLDIQNRFFDIRSLKRSRSFRQLFQRNRNARHLLHVILRCVFKPYSVEHEPHQQDIAQPVEPEKQGDNRRKAPVNKV